MINVYTKFTLYHGLDIQYDTTQWTTLPFLTERSKECVSVLAHNPLQNITNNFDLTMCVRLYNLEITPKKSLSILLNTMQRHVEHVQTLFLTSNDIVNRTQYPFYHSHQSVPNTLKHFKSVLTQYRESTSNLVAELGTKIVGTQPQDYQKGTPHHIVVGSLATASLGIGECSESMMKLAESLIVSHGCVDIMFVSFSHNAAKTGMETTHSFIVANIKTLPSTMKLDMSFQDFMTCLPDSAIVGDAFLGESYKPNNIPDSVASYFKAYGGNPGLGMVFHLYNFSLNTLGGYVNKAVRIVNKIQHKGVMPFEDNFSEADMNAVEDTILIQRLKEELALNFSGIKDNQHYVFAKANLNNKTDLKKALHVQILLGSTHVTFFKNNASNQKQVVIRKLNEKKIAQPIQNMLNTISF